jgi:integrase
LQGYRVRRLSDFALKYAKNGPIVLAHRVSNATINRELAVLRAALKRALDTDRRLSFTLPKFPMVREDNVRRGFISEAEFERLYRVLPYAGLRALAACSFYTGVRKGELTAVDWPQVDFDHGVITIFDTKNKRPREIPVFEGLMLDSLSDCRADLEQLGKAGAAVFVYEGRRIGDFKRAWKTAVVRVGHPDLLFHDLRRSANRNMRDMGVPQGIRMGIMGHQTPSMDRRYGIVDRTDLDVVRELYKRHTEDVKKEA